MKIRNLNRVSRFRIFERWAPDASFDGFSDVNIIYAGNGSGKSTFAEILDPERSQAAWAAGVEVELVDSSSVTRACRDASDPVWNNIALFNRHYVLNSINFEAGTARSMLALGPESADRKQRLTAAAERIGELEAARPEAVQNVSRSQQVAPQIATSTARTIHNSLSGVQGYGRNYTALNVKASLEEGYSDGEREALDPDVLRELTKDRAPDLLVLPEEPTRPPLTRSQVDELISESPIRSRHDRISGNARNLNWVRTGAELHDAGDQCLFCEGDVSSERLRLLADLIDASRDSFVGRLLVGQGELGSTIAPLDQWSAELPLAGALYADLQVEYAAVSAALRESIGVLRADITAQMERLNLKGLDPMFGVSEAGDAGDGWPVVATDAAQSIVDRHNVRAINHEETVSKAAREFELYQIGEIRRSYEDAVGAHADFARVLTDSDAELEKLRGEVERLQNQSLDPGPPAALLNDQLHALLGRSEIRLEPAGDGEYIIARDDAPAQDLSEGERTALSLLHFLSSLRDRGASLRDQIVVIDDPVSSLDEGIAFGVFAAVWSALIVPEICGCGNDLPCGCNNKPTAECNQLFVLTHSFEFFRKWVNQLTPAVQKAGRQARFLELDTRHVSRADGTLRRSPMWIEWPERELAMRMRSEYHYLFWRVGKAVSPVGAAPTVEQLMDLEALLPNAGRRLLESFLSFRLPSDIGKPLRDQLRTVLADVSDDQRRTRLHTFLNHLSHQEESGTVKALNRPEAPIVLRSVFELILDLDSRHFSGMCVALDLQPLELVDTVLTSDQIGQSADTDQGSAG